MKYVDVVGSVRVFVSCAAVTLKVCDSAPRGTSTRKVYNQVQHPGSSMVWVVRYTIEHALLAVAPILR